MNFKKTDKVILPKGIKRAIESSTDTTELKFPSAHSLKEVIDAYNEVTIKQGIEKVLGSIHMTLNHQLENIFDAMDKGKFVSALEGYKMRLCFNRYSGECDTEVNKAIMNILREEFTSLGYEFQEEKNSWSDDIFTVTISISCANI